MAPQNASESLALAKKHLHRVLASWDPPQWLDLSAYGLYALEAAVVAAVLHLDEDVKRTHWGKAAAATRLADTIDLPDVAELMSDLNEARKAEAYGDVPIPEGLDAEDVAREVEEYVDAVEALLSR